MVLTNNIGYRTLKEILIRKARVKSQKVDVNVV